MARCRLLDVPRNEPGSARRQPGVRRFVESQLQGAAGQSDRTHAVDEPGDGRRRGARRRGRGRADAGQLMAAVTRIDGRGLPVRGADIDTDRIMPARFLRSVTFDGLETHVFEDDRKAGGHPYNRHPFDVSHYRGASILLVNSNFGCGSSREHAPQGLQRWGIKAIVGESFAEIFFGNSAMIGMPCLTASPADVQALMDLVEKTPQTLISIDLREGT